MESKLSYCFRLASFPSPSMNKDVYLYMHLLCSNLQLCETAWPFPDVNPKTLAKTKSFKVY